MKNRFKFFDHTLTVLCILWFISILTLLCLIRYSSVKYNYDTNVKNIYTYKFINSLYINDKNVGISLNSEGKNLIPLRIYTNEVYSSNPYWKDKKLFIWNRKIQNLYIFEGVGFIDINTIPDDLDYRFKDDAVQIYRK